MYLEYFEYKYRQQMYGFTYNALIYHLHNLLLLLDRKIPYLRVTKLIKPFR
jgi:hypothetical protein